MTGVLCDVCRGGRDCGRGEACPWRAEGCQWCDNGEQCERTIAECPVMRRSALEAGIPIDVVMGRRDLSDAYSPREIRELGWHGREIERQEKIDDELRAAGRGYLVRR